MKRLFMLVFCVLAISFVGNAQATPKHTYLVGGCNVQANEALRLFGLAKPAPEFDLYVVCDPVQWHVLAQRNDFKEESHSFTVLHKHMIWLGPKALASLPEAVEHELEHLRCDCKLGE